MRILCFAFMPIFTLGAQAQTDSAQKFSFSAFGELYYSYDFSNPANHEKPSFVYNHSAAPTWVQFVYEANVGIKFSKRHQLWLEAGIMPSHVGFESAVSADC
jgi:hypothetical protein